MEKYKRNYNWQLTNEGKLRIDRFNNYNTPDYLVMSAIEEQGQSTSKEISDLRHISIVKVNVILGKLERMGYVKRLVAIVEA